MQIIDENINIKKQKKNKQNELCLEEMVFITYADSEGTFVQSGPSC